jgi:hypothetical protein
MVEGWKRATDGIAIAVLHGTMKTLAIAALTVDQLTIGGVQAVSNLRSRY